jgi:hypothetical protein
MSIIPTKILLATDGSKEAEASSASASDLSEKQARSCTSSVWSTCPSYPTRPQALQPWTRICGEGCKRVPRKRLEQSSTSRCSG